MSKPKLIVQKGAMSSEWGTPSEVLSVAKLALGGRFDLDLASSAKHNLLVDAKRFYSRQDRCPIELPGNPAGLKLWCNPPAGIDCVKSFWWTWRNATQRGAHGAFLIYQIDHWRSLIAPAVPCWCVLWPSRVRFIGAPSQAHFSSVLVLTAPPVIHNGANIVRWGVS